MVFTNGIPEILVKKLSALANTEVQGEVLTQLTPSCALDKAAVTVPVLFRKCRYEIWLKIIYSVAYFYVSNDMNLCIFYSNR